jgi:hypothetical protein
MNIFVLDNNPITAASMMCDKHVVKMIVESCQLLSTAHHVLDGKEIFVDSGKRKFKTFICNKPICKATMINHPCTIWTREASGNYDWLWNHAYTLCNEYTLRYGKIHSMQKMIEGPLYDCPDNINQDILTKFAQAMPDQYKNQNAVIAYRQYYIGEKIKFAKWKLGNVPTWFASQTGNTTSSELITS